MAKNDGKQTTHRRAFLGSVATGAAAFGMATFAAPLNLKAAQNLTDYGASDADEWFKKIKGKHRIVFDVTGPHSILPFAWPKVFLLTNDATGTPEKENSVVVVLRHNAIPYAMEDRLWAKYKFGEVFKIDDPKTKAPSLRNPFWKPQAGGFQIPGVGNVAIGINELQDSGVMFCVCAMAILVNSAVIAGQMNGNAEDVKKDFLSGVLPGVQAAASDGVRSGSTNVTSSMSTPTDCVAGAPPPPAHLSKRTSMFAVRRSFSIRRASST